jgi:sugar phosphate isomerase/epimerase
MTGARVELSFLMCEPVPRLDELARRMELLAELGYQGVELSACHPPPYDAEDVLALTERIGLPVVSMLSGWSYGKEGLCLSSPRDEVRAAAVDRLAQYAAYAARLRAVLVVGLMQGLTSDEPDAGLAGERIAAGLGEVAAAAARRDGTVVLEPVNHLQVGFHHTADEAAALVRRIGSPALTYMLDTLHLNIEERSVLGAIREHGPRVRHFHLCESNGGPFGGGNLDFAAVLAELEATGYRHYVSVKVYRRLGWAEAARQAIEFLRGMDSAAARRLAGRASSPRR